MYMHNVSIVEIIFLWIRDQKLEFINSCVPMPYGRQMAINIFDVLVIPHHCSISNMCSPTLNRQPYEGRLPLTIWWRKS